MRTEGRSVLAILGIVSTGILFFAPAFTLLNVCRRRSIGQLSFVPYILNLPNCLLWVLYGLLIVHTNGIFLTAINLVGFFLTAIYISIFFKFSDTDQRKREILKWLVAVALIFTSAVLLIFLDHNHKRRSLIFRIVCCTIGVAMYGSSLWDMPSIIRTRSVSGMSLWVTLAIFLNSSVWTVYSYKYFDIFLLIPNATGVFASIVKLVLYGIFSTQTLPGEQSDDTRQPLLQSTVPASMQSNEKNDDQLGDGAAQLNEKQANESTADQVGDGTAQLNENEADESSADQVSHGNTKLNKNEENESSADQVSDGGAELNENEKNESSADKVGDD